MDNKNRGMAVIINNQTFKGYEKLKEASEKDVQLMKDVLGKNGLGFKVSTRTNLSAEQIKNIFATTPDQTENDCFVAVILAHGNDKNVILVSDEEKVTITQLIEYLLPGKCDSLNGKPKLFFVYVCDVGTEVADSDINKMQPKIPTWADVLIYHSSVPGFYSCGDKFTGSWFLQSLGDVLKNHGKNMELTELLTMVNCKVAHEYNEYKSKKEAKCTETNYPGKIPTFMSTLTRQLYFS